MRVVLASERPQAQNLLTDVVEEEPGAIVVGQAENAAKTLGLVKNLKPDVAIIDSNLPYSVGSDTVALSRVSGLDTAQAICETIPNTRVIIINNLDTPAILEHGLSTSTRAFLSREGIEDNIALKLEELRHKVIATSVPVFANVEVEPWPIPRQKGDEVAGGAIFLGTAGIVSGGYLIGTLILAPVGALLALAGAATLSFGLLKKLTARVWRKER